MRKFIRKQAWLFILFFGLSCLTFYSYTESETRAVASLTPKQLMNESSFQEKKQNQNRRMIASTKLDLNSNAVLKVNAFCSEKLPKMFLKKSLVILQIDTCLKETFKANKFQVTNLTNGYKGQVFKTGLKKFKTDFIQLNDGTNQIQILFYTKDRQTITQTLEITSAS